LVVDLEDAADDRRAAVADENAPPVLPDGQRNVSAKREVQSDCRLALLDVDIEQYRSLVGDLRRHLELQRGVDVDDGGRVVDVRLHGDLTARLNGRRRVRQRGDLRGGDDLQ